MQYEKSKVDQKSIRKQKELYKAKLKDANLKFKNIRNLIEDLLIIKLNKIEKTDLEREMNNVKSLESEIQMLKYKINCNENDLLSEIKNIKHLI